ncbi:MAG: response regulator [Promethearchaeota archaeon]
MPEKIIKTKEMENYERQTGKKAIWRGGITENFKKWQKGDDDFEVEKERISLYVSKDTKNEWLNFANNNDYSTLSKLIREALKFFIEYRSKIIIKDKNLNIDLLSSLSHDLKEPLTSIKGYLQLVIESYGDNLEDNIMAIITKTLSQCNILEQKIIERLDKLDSEIEDYDNSKMKYDLLLIEDDSETSILLNSYFKSVGISCKSVPSGLKGLKELKRSRPNVILLDIVLPDINGFEFLKRIRTNNKIKDIPVYFLTAIPNVEIENKMKEFGVKGVISKPFNLSDFDILKKHFKKNDNT